MSEPESFYAAVDGGFTSTELTRGPWHAERQHAGPPAALLARAIERVGGDEEEDRGAWIVGRITFEILRPVPIARLTVRAGIARPGRRVEMIEAELGDESGEILVRARAWRLRRSRIELPEVPRVQHLEPEPAPPQALMADADAFFPTGFEVGYHTGMEYRFASGAFLEPGPAVCWMRMRKPLVAGERPTPLQRVLVAADSGNGISAALEFRRYLFVNVDLSVHLHRMPAGEWVCLDAHTIPEPTGVGISDTVLRDERGRIGRACQTLLVAER